MPTVSQRTVEYVIRGRDDASKSFLSFRKNALLAAGAVGVVGAAMAKAVNRAAEFETQMANVSTLISGDATKAMNELKDGVLEMSRSLPVSIDELGAGLYDVLSAGVEGAADQMLVLEESAKLAVAGLSTTQESVNIMTSAINAFGLEASDSNRIADILFKTVKSGKTTVAEMAQAFGATAPIIAARIPNNIMEKNIHMVTNIFLKENVFTVRYILIAKDITNVKPS